MPAPGLDLHKPSDASLLLLLGAPGIQVLRLRTDAARSRDAAVSVVVNMRRKRRWWARENFPCNGDSDAAGDDDVDDDDDDDGDDGDDDEDYDEGNVDRASETLAVLI